MAKWTSYSYFNLSAKGFDCLSYLALVYRRLVEWKTRIIVNRALNPDESITERITINTKFQLLLAFIPVAEIAPGVFIRGDTLPTGSLDRSLKSQGVIDTSMIQYPPVSEAYLRIQKGGIYRAAIRTGGRSTAPDLPYDWIYMPAANRFTNYSPDFADWTGANAVVYAGYTSTGNYTPVTWDETSATATLSLTFTASDCEYLFSFYPDGVTSSYAHLMSYDFSGNSVVFPSSSGYSMTLSMHCEKPQTGAGAGTWIGPEASYTPFYEIGDPIDNPLFTIPFARS